MKQILIIVLLLLHITAFSQASEWFVKNYPFDYNNVREDNHSVIKAKVIGIDKKTIKPDYLIEIEVDTVYSGKVDSSILLINVAMPAMHKKSYKNSQQFINSLQGKSIMVNMWKIYKFKDNDKHRISLYWTSAYSFFANGLIDEFSYLTNRNIALFSNNPSLFIADIDNYYFNIESVVADFYKAMQSDDCELLLKFKQKYENQINSRIITFLYSVTATYISNCKCE